MRADPRRYLQPVDGEASFEAAIAAWRAGDRDRALALLDAVIARGDARVSHWSTRGLWLEQLGRHEEALEAFRASTVIEPTYADHYNAGNMLLALRRDEEALVELDASIALNDRYPECWVNRGFALRRLGRSDDARDSFDRALTIDADFVPALRCKAMLKSVLGHGAQSEALYARVAQLSPDDARAAIDLARQLGQLAEGGRMELHPGGREWRAIEACKRARALAPDDPRPWGFEVAVLARLMLVHVCFRLVRPRDGGGADFELVPGPLETGRFADELIALCEAAMARFPEDAFFPSRLAVAFAHLSRVDDALEAARRAVALDPSLEADLLEALDVEHL